MAVPAAGDMDAKKEVPKMEAAGGGSTAEAAGAPGGGETAADGKQPAAAAEDSQPAAAAAKASDAPPAAAAKTGDAPPGEGCGAGRGLKRKEASWDAEEDEEEAAMRKRKVTMYGAKCPLGSQCKKGESYIKSCRTKKDAAWYAENHLMKSTYHVLKKEEVKELMKTRVEIEEWEIEEESASAAERSEDPNWWKWNQRQPMGPAHAQVPVPMGKATQALVDDAAVAGATALQRLSQKTVNMGYNELAACVDALRRAKYAANAAKSLCERAAKAFTEEERCLSCCHDVVRSYLPDAPGVPNLER